MNKLFTRFGKLQRTAKINSEGIGLGLMIVQQILESAGGFITASSPGPGLGSTFSFVLPMDPVEHQKTNSSGPNSINRLASFDIDTETVQLNEIKLLTGSLKNKLAEKNKEKSSNKHCNRSIQDPFIKKEENKFVTMRQV